jgi:hypothetical protein
MSTKPDYDQLLQHRARLAGCVTFEGFLEVQLAFIDLLISLYEKDRLELEQAAREILGYD